MALKSSRKKIDFFIFRIQHCKYVQSEMHTIPHSCVLSFFLCILSLFIFSNYSFSSATFWKCRDDAWRGDGHHAWVGVWVLICIFLSFRAIPGPWPGGLFRVISIHGFGKVLASVLNIGPVISRNYICALSWNYHARIADASQKVSCYFFLWLCATGLFWT